MILFVINLERLALWLDMGLVAIFQVFSWYQPLV